MSENIEIKILETLILYGEPMRAHWIAKKLSGASDSLVNYHLPKMVRKGLLLEDIQDGARVYKPQPIFMGAQHRNDFLAILVKYAKSKRNLIFVDAKLENEQVINVLKVLMELIEKKLRLEE